MRALRAWLVRLTGAIRGGGREREMTAEFESHLQRICDTPCVAGDTAPDSR